MNAIEKSISLLGNQSNLAKSAGVSQVAVSLWFRGLRTIKAESAVAIERATNGEVTRYDLRPDIFGPAPTQPQDKAA